MSPVSTRKVGKTPLEQLTYEQAVTELESIIAALESEENSLDECMALFERGQGLIRYCANLLDQAELKVQQLCADSLTEYKPVN
ncbi:MAG: exodeoxyribonuclease VII small subunit [Omnitrophica WOR_2 bacterium]